MGQGEVEGDGNASSLDQLDLYVSCRGSGFVGMQVLMCCKSSCTFD